LAAVRAPHAPALDDRLAPAACPITVVGALLGRVSAVPMGVAGAGGGAARGHRSGPPYGRRMGFGPCAGGYDCKSTVHSCPQPSGFGAGSSIVGRAGGICTPSARARRTASTADAASQR